ncbi:MAG: heterodisulfide reductase-related iron-sulfur binding cluster, partial [Myxococcota bacterium]|nr:heterodisulfide reductase-related iron-sulfur binding cluster [Myxococcota bacterium]
MTLPRPIKTIPADNYYLTPSCILGALSPATEPILCRLFDTLGLNWRLPGNGLESEHTCCSGILSHGDVMVMETTLLVVARLWSLAAEAGMENIATACVTSFAIHQECLELLDHEPDLPEKVDRWLREACGRALIRPKHVVHASDLVYKYRDSLAARMPHRLVEKRTGRPLRVVEHVGCHYAKVFPHLSVGGAVDCDVLAAPIRAWGGVEVDYPERRHCCGMGFRQCMIRPNRGYTMACVQKKLCSMAPYEPDLILTNCPGCGVFLDKGQHAVAELTSRQFDIPVLSYAELAALLLGWHPYDVVGVHSHTVPV